MNFYSYPGIMNKLIVDIEFEPKIQPDYVLFEVCKYFKQNPEKVLGNIRYKELVYCRHLVAFFLRKKTKLSLKEIASFLRRRNHTTIINPLEKMKVYSEIYKNINYEIHQLETIFRVRRRKLQSKMVQKGSLVIYYGYDKEAIKPGYFFEVTNEETKTISNPLGIVVSQDSGFRLDHNQMYTFMNRFQVGSKRELEKVISNIPL